MRKTLQFILSDSEGNRLAHYDNHPRIQESCSIQPKCLLECFLELVPARFDVSSVTKTVTRTSGESPDKYVTGMGAYEFQGVKTRTDVSKEAPDSSLMSVKTI